MSGLKTVTGFVIGIVLFAAVAAGIIKLQGPLAVKTLLVGAIAGFALIVAKMDRILISLQRAEYWARVNYIANETRRLDPEDDRPAKDIFIEDVRLGRADERGREIFGEKTVERVAWVLVILVFVALSWFFAASWPE